MRELSEFKGTRGLWYVEEDSEYQTEVRCNGRTICDFTFTEYNQELANAKLIAAAPEMLKQLKEVLSYLNSGLIVEAEEILTYKIKNLIKKATE